MSEFHPEIQRIEKIETHPQADAIELAFVGGDYIGIVQKNKYKAGDLVSVLPINTVVPDNETFNFLAPIKKVKKDGVEIEERLPVGQVPVKYRRIKAKKIRGVYSQILIVDAIPGMQEGDSLLDVLELKKWVSNPEEEDLDKKYWELNISKDDYICLSSIPGDAKSPPQGFAIPYYDLEGLRKYSSELEEGEEVIISEKMEGSSSSFVWDREEFWQKSRNLYKKDEEGELWFDASVKYKLREKLINYPMLAFFAECYGQINPFRYDCEITNGVLSPNLAFFDIYNLKQGRFLNYDDMVEILNKLELPIAPVLYRGPWKEDKSLYPLADGQSARGKHIKEGFVLKVPVERPTKSFGRCIFKLKGEDYSLYKSKDR